MLLTDDESIVGYACNIRIDSSRYDELFHYKHKELDSMNSDKILEGLSQEDRLTLLESLIRGAEQAQEENLSIKDRVGRLEAQVGRGPGRGRMRHGSRMSGCHCGCS